MEQRQRMREAQYRLAQHYLDTLHLAQKTYQQGYENVAYALAIFDREREQVQQWQAWATAHSREDDRAAALCSAYAEASPDIFRLRLLPREYITWLKQALEAARQLREQRAEATHLLAIYEASELILEYHHVLEYAQQALSIARHINDRSLVARSLHLLGNAARQQGKFEDAQTYFEQSLLLYQAINDLRGMAEQLSNLGALALILRNHPLAQDYLERSLTLCREIGEQEGVATCLNSLGLLAMRLGNYSAANEYLEQTLTLCRLMGNKHGLSTILSNLGAIAYYQEEYLRAQNYLEEALATMRTLGLRGKEASNLCRLGRVMLAQGDLRAAENYFSQSLAFRSSVETKVVSVISLGHLAIIFLLLFQRERADTALREAVEVASSLSVERAKLALLVAAVRAWVLQGKPWQAASWLGLIENAPDPDVQTTEMQKDVRVARAECLAAIAPEQFTAAWEEGKRLELDAVLAEILHELDEGVKRKR